MAKFHLKDERFYFNCPGCKKPHSIAEKQIGFNDNVDAPTIKSTIWIEGNRRPNPKKGKHGEPDTLLDVCEAKIKDGKITYTYEATHKLKKKTVEIPEWEGE